MSRSNMEIRNCYECRHRENSIGTPPCDTCFFAEPIKPPEFPRTVGVSWEPIQIEIELTESSKTHTDNKCDTCVSKHTREFCSVCTAFNMYESKFQTTAPVKSEGMKFDSNKPPLSRVPRVLLEEVARVLEFGANKYGWDNWRKGISYHRVASAAMRHLTAFIDCETIDSESQLHHIAHAVCCLTFLLEYESNPEKFKQFDDRFSYLNQAT